MCADTESYEISLFVLPPLVTYLPLHVRHTEELRVTGNLVTGRICLCMYIRHTEELRVTGPHCYLKFTLHIHVHVHVHEDLILGVSEPLCLSIVQF